MDWSGATNKNYHNKRNGILQEKHIDQIWHPQVFITNNNTQFIEKIFQGLFVELQIKQHFMFVVHSQTNEQAEVANHFILQGINRGLDDAKDRWSDELPTILSVYRRTPHSTTGGIQFQLMCGDEVVVRVESLPKKQKMSLYLRNPFWRTRSSNLECIQVKVILQFNNRYPAQIH